MVIGGVALRVNDDALSSGSLRLKRSTAEQFFGQNASQLGTVTCCDGRPTSLPERNTLPVRISLHTVKSSTGRTGASPQAPPSLHCELCGLGGWLRGQGAVPGVHWVQLWRGAGGALRLRLCDGKPTGVPGEEAADEQQQQQEQTQLQQRESAHRVVTTNTTAAPARTAGLPGATRESMAMAAADAVAVVVGHAAQDVADAAARWDLRAPNHGRLQGPAVGLASAEAAAGVGRVRRALPSVAASTGAVGAHGGAPAAVAEPHSPYLQPPPAQAGCTELDRVRSLLPSSMLQLPLESPASPAAPATPAATAAGGPSVYTVQLLGDRSALLGSGAFCLWPKAEALDVGRSLAVTLRLFVGDSSAGLDCPQAHDVGAALIRLQGNRFALVGVGRAGDSMSLARGPDGQVWAWLMQQQQQQQGQQQQQRQQRQQHQQRQQRPQLQKHKAAVPPQEGLCGETLPGFVSGSVSGWKIRMSHRAAGAFWRGTLDGDQLRSAVVVLHVAPGAGCGNSLGASNMGQGAQQDEQEQQQQEGPQQPQATLIPITVRVVCYRLQCGRNLWCLSAGVSALVAALGATQGDRVLLARLPDGRVTIRRLAGAEREAEAAAAPQVAQLERVRPYSQAQAQPSAEGSQRAAKRLRPAQEHGGVALQQHDEHQQAATSAVAVQPQQPQQRPHCYQQPHQCTQSAHLQHLGSAGPGSSRAGRRARLPAAAGPPHPLSHRALPAPPGSMLVGFARNTFVELRQAAVSAFFPMATGLTHGQTVDVVVHGPGQGAAGGPDTERRQRQKQQALMPYCLTLSFYERHHLRGRLWRLNGCAPLFRALGARKGDAVHMWRVAADGRLCAGVPPRDRARTRGRKEAAGRGVGRQVCDEYEVHETTEEDREEDIELDEDDSDAGHVEPSRGGGRLVAGVKRRVGAQRRPRQLGRGSGRPHGDEWELSEMSVEEEDAGAGVGVSTGKCGSGMDGLVGAGWGWGAVRSAGVGGGWWGGHEEVGAGGDCDGEEEGGDSGVEEEDVGLNCWLPAGGWEGGPSEEGGVGEGGVEAVEDTVVG